VSIFAGIVLSKAKQMKAKSFVNKIANFAHSRKFFGLIVVVFVIESAWLALSASYPMAFDEDFHFGIIKLYAKQWSPFFTHQPAGGNAYGALTSDPSYLYHYLMSFPYRVITLFTSNETAQIISLRLIDVALVAWSLFLFRRVLLKTKASSAIVNITLLFSILVPVVPLLAAQINYDDLLMPLTALTVLMTMQFKERLEEGVVSVGLCLKLAALCMFASLVQFEFLPIFVAVTGYVGYNLWRFKRRSHRLQRALSISWHLTKRVNRFAYIALFLVAFGLFGGRYGTNLVAYKNPVPQCNQVLTIAQCSEYSPWLRNYKDELNKVSVNMNPALFTAHWLHAMFFHSFFSSSGGGDSAAYYINVPPLPIVSITAVAVFSIGTVLFVYYRKTILQAHPMLGLLLFVGFAYCLTLWLWNYHDFLHLGEAVALNGRYLFPVIPLFMLAVGLGYQQWLRQRQGMKAVLLVVTLVLFMEGGGALTFIDVSNSHWYWHNSFARGINAGAQKVIKPLILN
jgi:hypothetical protein